MKTNRSNFRSLPSTFLLRSHKNVRKQLRVELLEHRITLDGSDPLGVILQAPDANNQVAIQFTRPVTGVDLSDFTLTRAGTSIDLGLAGLEASSSQDYVLSLPELFEDGAYALQLLAENSGIADEADPLILLEDDALAVWTRDTLAPSLSFAWTAPTIETPTQLRIAAMGDSQTTEAGNSYVPYLRQRLSSAEYSVSIYAEAGWQVPQVQGLWNSSVRDAGYDLAIFFTGVNDLISTNSSPEEIFAGLSTMFDEALARNMPVIAVGVSPWSHYGSSTALKQNGTLQLNELIAQYAIEHSTQVRYVDSRAALRSSPDPQRLAARFDSGDGLHLSGAGDKQLASLIATAVNELRPVATQSASVSVTVSEPVINLAAVDFQLLRNGVAHLSTASTISEVEFRFDFETPANDDAEYTIQWIGAEPIADLYGNLLTSETTSTVTIDRQAPTAQLSLPLAEVSSQTVSQLTIEFSEAVTGVSLEDLQLVYNGQEVDLNAAMLTEITPSTYLLNLQEIAATDGTYQLVLASGEAGIEDSSGNVVRTPATVQWVRLFAEPTLVDGLLTIATTTQSETLEVNIFADSIDLWINGLRTQLSLANVSHVQIDPLDGLDVLAIELLTSPELPLVSPWLMITANSSDGIDHVSLYGSSGDDALQSSPLGVVLTNPLIELRANNAATARIYGSSTDVVAGNDIVTFTDSSAADRLVSRPEVSQWTAPTYEHWAHNFATVVAHSSGGGDTATLYDSDGDDLYTGSPTRGELSGAGYDLQVNGFPIVSVLTSLGLDTAVVTGAASVDSFIAQSQTSAFYGTGYRHNLSYFESTEAIGNGGNDIATLYDGTGPDTTELSPWHGRMVGTNSTKVATQFWRINAYSRFGADTVTMRGSSGTDTFTGQETSASLVGTGYGLYAYRFPSTTAIGMGGNDIARLYDSPNDDRFDSNLQSVTLTTPTYTLTAEQFPIVYAYARTGNDLAFLNGREATETYSGYTTYGSLSGNGRTHYAYGFDNVTATGGGGSDLANLYDSNNNDTLLSSPSQTQFTGPGFQHTVSGFPRINTYARTGYDTAQLDGSTGNDIFSGQVTVSFLTGANVSNYAYGFDRVTSNSLGGNDTATIYDSTGDDVLVATPTAVTLQSGALSQTALNYSRTNVFSRSGYDIATMVGSPGVDNFTGQSTVSSMTGSGYINYAYAFDAVVAESAGGADIANLYDSTGDDVFFATSMSATLSGFGFRYTANAFSRVNAYSRSGYDTAQLIGSARSETVVVRPEYAYIKMSTYLNFASGFDSVWITGGGGNDSAYLYDSVGNDQLMIGNRTATLLGSTWTAMLDGFFRINAYASGGSDRVTLSDTLGNEVYTGRHNLGTLTSSGFTATLNSFDVVALAPAIGGTNTLDIADLNYILEVGWGWQ